MLDDEVPVSDPEQEHDATNGDTDDQSCDEIFQSVLCLSISDIKICC